MPRVLGDSVMLREYRQEDLPEIRKWVYDSQVTRFLSTVFWPPQTMVDTQHCLDRMMESSATACNFVIADRESERYIGQLDIFRLDYRLRQGELGMVVGDGGDRGRGLGAEALGLVLRHAFLALGLERVELEVDMENLEHYNQ